MRMMSCHIWRNRMFHMPWWESWHRTRFRRRRKNMSGPWGAKRFKRDRREKPAKTRCYRGFAGFSLERREICPSSTVLPSVPRRYHLYKSIMLQCMCNPIFLHVLCNKFGVGLQRLVVTSHRDGVPCVLEHGHVIRAVTEHIRIFRVNP